MSKSSQFIEAAKSGDFTQLELLWNSSSSEEQQKMIKIGYIALEFAAHRGHVQAMDKLLEYTDKYGLQQEMQKVANDAFYSATRNGQLQVMDKLWEWADKQGLQQAMLEAEEYGAFHWAVLKGQKQIMNKLLEWATPFDELQQKMLQVANDAFSVATRNGRAQVMDKLWEGVGKQGLQQAMLKANRYRAFSAAALSDEVQVIKKLWEWASEQTKRNILDQDKHLHPMLPLILETEGYSKLLIDIFVHMSPELCTQTKATFMQKTNIIPPANFDQLVRQKRKFYADMRETLKAADIGDHIANSQVFVALRQTAKILAGRELPELLKLTGKAEIALFRPLWPQEIENTQIGKIVDRLRYRNFAAVLLKTTKLTQEIGLNWGNFSPHTRNSGDIAKVLYNLASNQARFRRRWVDKKEVTRLFVEVMFEVCGTMPFKEIDIDQFIAGIQNYKWATKEQTQDKEIPADDRETIIKELVSVMTNLAKASLLSKEKPQERKKSAETNISLARQVCEQLYPLRSRNVDENILATTLQARLQSSDRVQELESKPEVLEQFINILGAQLKAVHVNYKIENSELDSIISAALEACAETRAVPAIAACAALPALSPSLSPARSWVETVALERSDIVPREGLEPAPKRPGSKRKASVGSKAPVEKKALVRDPNAAGLGL